MQGIGSYADDSHWEKAEKMDAFEAGRERAHRQGDYIASPKKAYDPPWLKPGIPMTKERSAVLFPLTCRACGHVVESEHEIDGVGHPDSTETADQCPECMFYNTY